jgi:hypothetical protein
MVKSIFLLIVPLFIINLIANCAQKTWIGSSGGIYSTGSNWAPSGSPTNADDILILGFTGTIIVDGPKSPNSFAVRGNSNVTFSGNNNTTSFTFATTNTYFIEGNSTMTCTGTTNSNVCDIIMGSLSNSLFAINGVLNIGDAVTYTGATKVNCANGSRVVVNGSLNFVGSSSSVVGSSFNSYVLNPGGVQEMKRTSGGQFPVGDYSIYSRTIISGVSNASYPTFSSSQTTTWGNIEFNAPNNIAIGTGGACLFSSNALCESFKVINTGTGNCNLSASGTVTRTITVNNLLQVNNGCIINLNSTTSGSPTASSGFAAKGDVLINGTLTETGNALASKLSFEGSALQNITIATVTNDVSLEFNNNAGFITNNSITMPFNVNSIVTLTNGKINLNTYTFEISNRNSTALTGGGNNTFFYNGFLKRGIDAVLNSYSFPLGNGTDYKPATIDFTTAPSIGKLTANFSTTPPNFPNPSSLTEPVGPINNISLASLQGSWFINKDIILTGGVYTGTFTSYGATDIIDYTKIVLLKRPSAGGNWILDGTHITTTGSNTAAVLSRTGMSGFSEFAIGGQLNVSLLNTPNLTINAVITGSTNTVNWNTVTESNNFKFIIEKSTSGNNFIPIGEVATKALNGNSSVVLQYNYIDINPIQGKQYYRLKIVDIYGKETYSQIVTLRRGAGKLEIVDVRPNPTTGTVYFNVLGSGNSVTVVVNDLSGKLVINKGLVQNNNFSIDMSTLVSGMYVLAATDTRTGEKSVFKILKN